MSNMGDYQQMNQYLNRGTITNPGNNKKIITAV